VPARDGDTSRPADIHSAVGGVPTAAPPEMGSTNGDPPAPPDANGPPPPPTGRGPRRLLGPYDALLSVLLIALWLLPITYVGATKRDVAVLPDWLSHQHRVSCLFINKVKGWQSYQLEVQRGGSGRWEQMSEENYFELPVFGYRSRLHRVLGHSYKRGKGAQRMREMGLYIKERYDQLNPDGPSLDALRYVRIYMTNEMLAKQTGRFKTMQPSEVPYNYVLYFGEMRFDDKRPTHGGWGKTAPRPAAPTTAAPSTTAPTAPAHTAGPTTGATLPKNPVEAVPPPTGEQGDL
jgi:hypothetical protein